MIRFTRSVRIASGKFTQAIQWAKETTEFLNKKYKAQVSVYMDSFGEIGTIRWFVDFPDLATFEKQRNQEMADREYLQKMNQAGDLFIQSSGYDTVMQSI